MQSRSPGTMVMWRPYTMGTCARSSEREQSLLLCRYFVGRNSACGTKRTFRGRRSISAFGEERKSLHHAAMSDSRPKRTVGLIRLGGDLSSMKGSNDYLKKSLDRNTIARSAWVGSSKNLRDAHSSIPSRSRIN